VVASTDVASSSRLKPATMLTGEATDEAEPIATATELLEQVLKFGEKGLSIQRYKGLGEMNPDQLAETTMNPETRTLLQVTVEDMVEALLTHKLTTSSPNPSIETLLHAFLPHAYVDHSHADAILALTNLDEGERVVRDALGEHIFEWFLRNKRSEWADYQQQVSQWELNRYLRGW